MGGTEGGVVGGTEGGVVRGTEGGVVGRTEGGVVGGREGGVVGGTEGGVVGASKHILLNNSRNVYYLTRHTHVRVHVHVSVLVSLLCTVKLHRLTLQCSLHSMYSKVKTMLGAFCLSLGVMCYHSQYVRLTFNRREGGW